MLDVLHYLFESDTDFYSKENLEAKDFSRKIIYKNIYNTEYPYAQPTAQSSSYEDFDYANNDYSSSQAAQTTSVKPFIPATNFNPDSPNPFQGSLRESPLG